MAPTTRPRWADMTDDDDDQATSEQRPIDAKMKRTFRRQEFGFEWESFKRHYLATRCSLTLLTPVHASARCSHAHSSQ